MSITDQKWRLNNLYRIIDRDSNSIPFKLNAVQCDVLNNLHNRNLILKARQLGMSTFAVLYLLDCVLFTKNLSAGIVSYSLEHAQHIFKRIIGHALDTLPSQIKGFTGIVQRSAREISFNNGSSLRVDTTLRGGSYPLVLVSEFGKTCARNPQKAEEVITGTLQAVPRDGTIIIESTGEGNEGFFAEMVMEASRRGNEEISSLEYHLFFYPWMDEPTYQLHETDIRYEVELTDYFDAVEKETNRIITQPQRNWYAIQSRILGDKIKQEFPSTVSEAFLTSSDAYYFAEAINKAYDDRRCLYSSLYDALLPLYVAMDIGVNDLTVMVFFQLNHGEIRIIDYYEDKNKGVDFYAKFLLQDKKYLYHTIFLPHDSVKRDALDTANTYERDFRRLFSQTSTVFHVLKRMDKQLSISHAKIMIDRCVFNAQKTKPLIDKLQKYRKKWNETLGRYMEEPLHNEACFIGETLIETSKGKVRIDKITKGDFVLTPKGYKKVLNVFDYESKNILKISTKENSITCTPHHKIFTTKGLVNADSLCYDDRIITLKDKDLCQKILFHGTENIVGFKEIFLSISTKNLSILMDTSIKKTNLDIGLEEQLDQKRDMVVCTELFGHTIMGKYQRKCISTIKMAISQIMKLKILKSLNLKNILNCITQKKKKKDQDTILISAEKKQKNGIVQKKGLNGIDNMERKHLKEKLRLKKFALYVKKIFIPFGKEQSYVLAIAGLNQEDCLALTMKSENALTAVNHSDAINMIEENHVQSVVHIKLESTQKVYDIEVEEDHCYYANGLLVSNSNYGDAFQYACQAVSHLETIGSLKGAFDQHKKATDARLKRIY